MFAVEPESMAALFEYWNIELETCKDPDIIALPLTSSFAFGVVVPIPTFAEVLMYKWSDKLFAPNDKAFPD